MYAGSLDVCNRFLWIHARHGPLSAAAVAVVVDDEWVFERRREVFVPASATMLLIPDRISGAA